MTTASHTCGSGHQTSLTRLFGLLLALMMSVVLPLPGSGELQEQPALPSWVFYSYAGCKQEVYTLCPGSSVGENWGGEGVEWLAIGVGCIVL